MKKLCKIFSVLFVFVIVLTAPVKAETVYRNMYEEWSYYDTLSETNVHYVPNTGFFRKAYSSADMKLTNADNRNGYIQLGLWNGSDVKYGSSSWYAYPIGNPNYTYIQAEVFGIAAIADREQLYAFWRIGDIKQQEWINEILHQN